MTLAHVYIIGADCPAHAPVCFHVWAHLTNLETLEGLFVVHSLHLQVESLSELDAFISLLLLFSAHLNFKATAIRNLLLLPLKENVFGCCDVRADAKLYVLGKCTFATKVYLQLLFSGCRGTGDLCPQSCVVYEGWWGPWKGLPKEMVPKLKGPDEVQASLENIWALRWVWPPLGSPIAGGVRTWSPASIPAATL